MSEVRANYFLMKYREDPPSVMKRTETLWYIRKGQDLSGPFTTKGLRQEIESRKFVATDRVWMPGSEIEWQELRTIEEFLDLFKVANAETVLLEVDEDEATVIDQSRPKPQNQVVWYLQFKDGRTGPFTVSELSTVLQFKDLTPPVYCWRTGWKDWKPVGEVEELSQSRSSPNPKVKKAVDAVDEKRGNKRSPLMATVSLVGEKARVIGICRNISLTGMQVLGSLIPGGVGTNHSFEVFPSLKSHVRSFRVSGTIVRILKDRPGFAMKFSPLSREVQEALKRLL